jgi:hypothetical protein
LRNGIALTEDIDPFSFSSKIGVFDNIFSKQITTHVIPHMVLSDHLVLFVYMSLPRSLFASRPYNYGLCGVLGWRT